ncbi:MAG: pyridoxal-dependent decarboxylase [Gemmatimonadales bacterium]|jgi:aromatic-L-amino-acid decarboxylase
MPQSGDILIEEFKRAASRAIDWIASYLSHPEEYPVLAQVEPGEVKAALPASPPSRAESLDDVLADFEKIVVPGITHWNHPCFFAYFGITGSAPGILGELLSAALNVNGMLWQTSPAATELEEVALDWLRELLGLPEGFDGVIMDTASVSTLCAIAAARHALSDLEIRERGMSGRSDLPLLRLYTSQQAHSSVEKAALVLGLGKAGVRKIPTDDAFRMDAGALESAIAEDRAAGHRPFCVTATVGTTSTTSIDPVPAIAEICRSEGLWLHVDAAYAGSAAVIPEYRHVLAGCDAATSIVVNPHKWLFTPIDCSALYTTRPEVLTGAFSLVPEYLRTAVDGAIRNYMDWGVSLGRRFRALKLWMVLRCFGSDGIAVRLKEHIRLAQLLADWIDEHPGFERLAPTPLSVVCFRARPSHIQDDEDALNAFNEKLLQRLNAGGAIYLSHTDLNGRYTLRLAIGNVRTEEEHIVRAWELVRAESEQLAVQ